MEWLRLNDDGEIEFVSEEIKLVPEMQALLALKYNKAKGDLDGRKRYRALNELKYMYLNYSIKGPYRDYSDADRLVEAKLDCSLPGEWEESTELKLLIPKYLKGSKSKLARLLTTTEGVLDKLDAYFNSINLLEKKDNGEYVNDPKKIMDALKQLPGLAQTLQELEQQVKIGSIGNPRSKGDHTLGWMAEDQNKKKKTTTRENEPEAEEDL